MKVGGCILEVGRWYLETWRGVFGKMKGDLEIGECICILNRNINYEDLNLGELLNCVKT